MATMIGGNGGGSGKNILVPINAFTLSHPTADPSTTTKTISVLKDDYIFCLGQEIGNVSIDNSSTASYSYSITSGGDTSTLLPVGMAKQFDSNSYFRIIKILSDGNLIINYMSNGNYIYGASILILRPASQYVTPTILDKNVGTAMGGDTYGTYTIPSGKIAIVSGGYYTNTWRGPTRQWGQGDTRALIFIVANDIYCPIGDTMMSRLSGLQAYSSPTSNPYLWAALGENEVLCGGNTVNTYSSYRIFLFDKQ